LLTNGIVGASVGTEAEKQSSVNVAFSAVLDNSTKFVRKLPTVGVRRPV
jgi:hypothetical protein